MECYKEVGNVIYTIDELLELTNKYITDENQIKLIKYAYLVARRMHYNQRRKSGEEYIIHPLNVAYIAATYHLDYETICASLLHDVVEDTTMSLEELKSLFGEKIAILVDGVTKISNMKFSTKDQEIKANQNKILHGMCQDVRIIFIKLADRLHNMRTISSMPSKKQLAKANETYELYVPLAYRYGLYRVKEELEDISFFYRNRSGYERTLETIETRKHEFYSILSEMKKNVYKNLISADISPIIEESIKNVHGVYRRLSMGIGIENMHDLLSLKVIVSQIPDCYRTLGVLHSLYHHVDGRFKDYVFTPKSNNYRSLHTVLFSGTDYLVQARIRTPEMNRFATSGIMTYYQENQNQQEDIKKKLSEEFRFFKELVEASSLGADTDVRKFVNEQMERKINVYTPDGTRIELPLGSTPIDVAFKLGEDYVIHFDAVFANNRPVGQDYRLNDGDIIKIVKNEEKYAPCKKWLHSAKTNYAKDGIKTLRKKN